MIQQNVCAKCGSKKVTGIGNESQFLCNQCGQALVVIATAKDQTASLLSLASQLYQRLQKATLIKVQGYVLDELGQLRDFVKQSAGLLTKQIDQKARMTLIKYAQGAWQPPNKITNQMTRLQGIIRQRDERILQLQHMLRKAQKRIDVMERKQLVQQQTIRAATSGSYSQLARQVLTSPRKLSSSRTRVKPELKAKRQEWGDNSQAVELTIKVRNSATPEEYGKMLADVGLKHPSLRRLSIFLKDKLLGAETAQAIGQQLCQFKYLRYLLIQNFYKECKSGDFEVQKEFRRVVGSVPEGFLLASRWV